MKTLLTGTQMKQADTWSIQEFGMESLVLMERAALCVAEHILSGHRPGRVFLLSGMGNNGADGLAIARILDQNGWQVSVLAIGKKEKATKEWLYQKKLLDQMNIEVIQISSDLKEIAPETTWEKQLSDCYPQADVYVDALFGIGLSREVTGVYRAAIEQWNIHKEQFGAYGVAVDICSGLDAKTGQVLGVCIEADLQITFGYGKLGQFLYPGTEIAKKTIVADIGFPRNAADHIEGMPSLCLEQADAAEWLGTRTESGNKGTFGRVVIIAGSEGMAGAAYLSALAAYRTGAGLVEIVTPECNRLVLQQLLPEAVLHCIPSKMEKEVLSDWLCSLLLRASAVVIGPGLSKGALAENLLEIVLQWNYKQNCPIVIDADALNLLAKWSNAAEEKAVENKTVENKTVENTVEEDRIAENEIAENKMADQMKKSDLSKSLGANVILTPHPGELGRLLGISTKQVTTNLIESAKALQEKFHCICVCKDARTVILTEKEQYLNLTGNSGMATGGSGDVLTGVIASLSAQGLPAAKAAVLGVWLHGAAGDAAAEKISPYSMIARDLTDGLKDVLKQISRKKG